MAASLAVPTPTQTFRVFETSSSFPIATSKDSSSQTIIFGVFGTLIGVLGLVFAGFTLRLMYRSQQRESGLDLPRYISHPPPYFQRRSNTF
ncbi:hypothetical protein BCR34DRAFT_598414 [Clohesyomyces aquaticus]|uniref:Uncharacterized protein n=1 Tax=Clohesyomyces aquaticus TaxID=1231657 RepID=A0A1Y1ZYT4_9PLEO|nr:hypothetical protein BCR34DRAFT_598414 [Clohesyomyces aquaticus]